MHTGKTDILSITSWSQQQHRKIWKTKKEENKKLLLFYIQQYWLLLQVGEIGLKKSNKINNNWSLLLKRKNVTWLFEVCWERWEIVVPRFDFYYYYFYYLKKNQIVRK